MHTYLLKDAQPADAPLLTELYRQSFAQAYAHLHSPANIQTYSAANHRLADAQAVLNDPHACVRIAYRDRQAAGFSVVRRAACPLEDVGGAGEMFELQKLYLLEAHYGQGLGLRLFEDAVQISCEQGAKSLWLYVSDQNPRAKAFYCKQGFSILGAGPALYVGTDQLSSSVMALSLTNS